MKVAVIGASGQAGSRILSEMTRRGHQVTGIARHPDKIAAGPGVTAKKGDVFDKDRLVALLMGHDAVVSSVHFTASDPQILIKAGRGAGRKRARAARFSISCAKSRRSTGPSCRPPRCSSRASAPENLGSARTNC